MSITRIATYTHDLDRVKANNVFVRNGILYGDYLTPGTAVLSTGNSPPDMEILRDTLALPAFDGAGVTTEQVFFTCHILHNIYPGSVPTIHVHWTHNTAVPSGNVKWFIDASYADGYGSATYPAPTTYSTVQTAGAQYTHHITNDDDMPLSGISFEPDGQLICRLYRDPTDGSDTFEHDAFLIGVDVHFQMGQLGTIERNRPYTAEGF